MTASEVLAAQAVALQRTSTRVGTAVATAAATLVEADGQTLITGVGKSAFVAQKLAASLRSIGHSAHFLDPLAALHGDLGAIRRNDVIIFVSKSGTTTELLSIARSIKPVGVHVIAIVGNTDTGLAGLADCVIDASVVRESDPLNTVPTASTTVAMAVGDALTVELMQRKGTTTSEFLRSHPNGQIGSALSRRVSEVMQTRFATVPPTASLRDAVIAMSKWPVGMVCVVDENRLSGIFTDGDLRRAVEAQVNIDQQCVGEIMTRNPVRVAPSESVAHAIALMENRPSQLSGLPVVDSANRPLGVMRLHDAYQVVE